MRIRHRITHRIKFLAVLALSLGTLASVISSARADGPGHRSNPLPIKGYQTYTNVSFVDPANPTILQVRTGGEGGVSHLGKMRSWSTDQTGNLVTGELQAHYTFEDEKGDQLLLSAVGTSAFQPDGRITFQGEYTVTGGTGRFKHASGKLHFEGWARTTDYATGVGIGFGTIEGVLRGTKIDRDTPFVVADSGIGTISANGQDFTYAGAGFASGVGKFESEAQSTTGPFHSAFVGIVDGRFLLSSSFEALWTTRNGDQLRFSAVEFISFAILTLPDGTPVPDLSQPSLPELYYTVTGGTGRFQHAQGVYFAKGTFTPNSPNTVAAEWKGAGFLSRNCSDR